MNALDMARTAYASSSTSVRTPRSIEYGAFARVTQRLRETADHRKENFSALVAALHDNRKLWTILAMDVAGSDNGLPAQLRAQIFYLAEFTQAQTAKVLNGDPDIGALVDINTSVMRGLRPDGAAR